VGTKLCNFFPDGMFVIKTLMNSINVGASSDDIITFFSFQLRKIMDLLSYPNLDLKKEFYEFLE
jgi:hypothetical protein